MTKSSMTALADETPCSQVLEILQVPPGPNPNLELPDYLTRRVNELTVETRAGPARG